MPLKPPAANERQPKSPDQPSVKKIRPDSPYLRGASVAVLVSLLIVAFIVGTMRGTTHQTTEPARITIQEATIVGPLVQHNVPTATVFLKNTRTSPARTTRARLVMTVWTSTTFPDWDMPLQLTNDVQDLGNINSGATVSQTVSLVAPLTDVQGMHLERKDWFIVILGVVAYDDTAGHSHQTELCLIWRDTSDETMSPCEKWNEVN